MREHHGRYRVTLEERLHRLVASLVVVSMLLPAPASATALPAVEARPANRTRPAEAPARSTALDPIEVLYDQYDLNPVGGVTGEISQDFTDPPGSGRCDDGTNNCLDNAMADDFEVPENTEWRILQVELPGYYAPSMDGLQGFNLTFYEDDSGRPGATSCSYTLDASSISDFNHVFDLPQACLLNGGGNGRTYWVSLQAVAFFDNANGTMWHWVRRPEQRGNAAKWRNPADGYGTGCTDWTDVASCAVSDERDLYFRLLGERQGGPPPPVDCASLIDETAPDPPEAEPNGSFSKAWRFSNCGNTGWADVVAEKLSGDGVFPASFDVPDAQPGEQVWVTNTFRAPATPGTYSATYQLSRGGDRFGPEFGLQVQVVIPNYCARFVRHLDSYPQPRPVNRGDGFDKSWLIENCGNRTWDGSYRAVKTFGLFGPDVLVVPPLAPHQSGVVTSLIDVPIDLSPGLQLAIYRLEGPAGQFGDAFWVNIDVLNTPTNDPRRAQLVSKYGQLREVTKRAIETDIDTFSEIQARYAKTVRLQPDSAFWLEITWDIGSLLIPGENISKIPEILSKTGELISLVEGGVQVLDGLHQLAGELPADPSLDWPQLKQDYIRPYYMNAYRDLLDEVDQRYDQVVEQLPDPLPAEYPLEEMVDYLDLQIAQFEAAMARETWVTHCTRPASFRAPPLCDMVKLGVLQQQLLGEVDVIERVERDETISFSSTLVEIGVFAGFGLVKVASLLGVVTAIPSEVVLWGGAAAVASVPVVVGSLSDIDSLTQRHALTKLSLDAVIQLANDLQVRQTLFQSTSDLLLTSSALKGQAGARQATGQDQASRDASPIDVRVAGMEVPDLLVEEGQGVGSGTARIRLQNADSTPVRAVLYGSLTATTADRPMAVSLIGAESVEIEPGEQRTVQFPYTVFRSSLVSNTGYDLHLMLALSDGLGRIQVRGPLVAHFYAGTEAQVGTLRRQGFTPLAQAWLDPGGVQEETFALAPTTQTARLLLSFPEEIDVDLHLYDSRGRHVGLDYGSGELELNIPGATYFGPASWPEMISLSNVEPGSGEFTVRVVSRDPDRGADFHLSVLETPRLPALLESAPKSTWFLTRTPGEASQSSFGLLVREAGGSQSVNGLQATASDFEGDLGPTIPAESVSLAVPARLAPGESAMVTVTFDLGAEVPDGVYLGTIDLAATDPAGTPLESSSRVGLVVSSGNRLPRAMAGGPYQVDEGQPLVLDGSASIDPEGGALRFRWDADDDGVWDTPFTDDPTASIPTRDDFAGEAMLQVIDDGNLTATDTAAVQVRNVAPIVEAGPDVQLVPGETFVGQGSFDDPGADDTHSILWDFGDGTTANDTLTPSHVYPTQGTYQITLTVTDDDGGSGSDRLTAFVRYDPGLLPLGWWKLDEADGPLAADDGSADHDGALQGDPSWVDGYLEGALALDGVNDFVQVGHFPDYDLSTAVSVSAWVDVTAPGEQPNPAVLGIPKAFALRLESRTTRPAFAIHDPEAREANQYGYLSCRTETALETGTWHHLAGTYSAEDRTLRLYLDGEEACSLKTHGGDGAFSISRSSLDLGRWTPNGSYFHGALDDVRLYDRALSSEEVKLLAQSQASPPPPATPTALAATPTSPTTIDLTWTDASEDELGFTIERKSAASNGLYVPLATLPSNTSAFTDTDLDPDTTFVYRLRAYGPGGFSAYSDEAAATSPPDGPEPPLALPLGWWKFDQMDGSIARDDGRGDHDGTLHGEPAWTEGRLGGALAFDGVDDFVEIGRFPEYDFPEAVSVSAWVNVTAPGQQPNPAILGIPKTFALQLESRSLRPSLLVYDPDATPRSKWGNVSCHAEDPRFPNHKHVELTPGKWYHLAGTYSASDRTLRVYLDGMLICSLKTREGDGLPADILNPLELGRWTPNGSYFHGALDDVRLYDRALSHEEVFRLAMLPTPSNPPPAAPSDLSALADSASAITLSWTDNATTERGFALERKSAATNAAFVPLAQVDADVTSYTDSGLQPNTAYVYRLRAFGPDGYSDHSNESAAVTQPEGTEPTPTPPLAWWKLDESEGTNAADAAGDHHGTLQGDPQWIEGRIGGALAFDSASLPRDSVDVGRSPDFELAEALTISTWVKVNPENPAFNPNPALAGLPQAYALRLNSSSTLPSFTIYDPEAGRDDANRWGYVNCNASAPLEDTQWHHLAGTYDAKKRQLTLYLDGARVCALKTDGGNGKVNLSRSALALGYWHPNRSYFNGALDDVRLYDRALSHEEVFQLALGLP